MKNLAIILGITDYEDEELRLPACTKDVQIMEQVCRTGGKFDDVITITSADSEILKNRIAETVDRFQHDDINHLFFYFTGHGDYLDEDFRYLLRDYDKSRTAQTSLSNTELDSMLHGLSPNLLIKVIDACYSGIAYIKDGTSISNYLADEIKSTFPRCYFFFSSQSDQKSYAECEVSDFTAAFATAVATSRLDTVRYKHVADSISDAFSSRRKQIPQFVIQAALTEILGEYSTSAKENLLNLIGEQTATQIPVHDETLEATERHEETLLDTAEDTPAPPSSLADMARKSATHYAALDQAKALTLELQRQLTDVTLTEELGEIYSLEKTFSERYQDLPNPSALGKWLDANKLAEYFATPSYSTETYESPRLSMGSFLGLGAGLGYEQPSITKTRQVINGITTQSTGLPFLTSVFTLSPQLPNLLRFKGWLVLVFSKTTLQIFYCFSEYREVSWGNFEPNETSNWHQSTVSLTTPDEASVYVQQFHSALSQWVIERTRARLTTISSSIR